MALKNSQYNTIMRQYDRLQLDNQHRLSERRQKIYEQLPEYRELDIQTAEISAAHARRALIEPVTSMPAIRAELEAIEVRKRALLKAYGYPASYLELNYLCPDCQDTGYIGAEKCHCFKQAIVDYVYAQSNIKDRLTYENFSAFDISYYSEEIDRRLGVSPRQHMEMILKVTGQFIQEFPRQPGNFLFTGSTGVGKTFLSNCIAKSLLDNGHTVIYLTAFQFVDILEANTFGSDDDSDDNLEMFQFIFDCDLLIIDDLGTEVNNSFITSQLFLCINERAMKKRSTIISTNLSLENLENEYSERIFSRLISDYQIFHIFGEDIRVKKAISS